MDGFGGLCGGDDGDGRGGGEWRRRQEGVQCRWSRAGAFHHSMGTSGIRIRCRGRWWQDGSWMRLLPPGQGRLFGRRRGCQGVGRQATGGDEVVWGRRCWEGGRLRRVVRQWKLAAAVGGDGDGDSSGSGSDSDSDSDGPEAGPRTTQTRRSGSQQGRQGDNDWPQAAAVPRMEPGLLELWRLSDRGQCGTAMILVQVHRRRMHEVPHLDALCFCLLAVTGGRRGGGGRLVQDSSSYPNLHSMYGAASFSED